MTANWFCSHNQSINTDWILLYDNYTTKSYIFLGIRATGCYHFRFSALLAFLIGVLLAAYFFYVHANYYLHNFDL